MNRDSTRMHGLSRLTLGTAQIGLNYGIANRLGKPSLQDAFEMLDTAWEGGITSMDTAASYGNAEVILGKYFAGKEEATKKLQPLPFIITKWHAKDSGRYQSTETVLKDLVEIMRRSIERLNISFIPCMMLHSPLLLKFHGRAVIQQLRTFVKQGLIGQAGISLAAHTDQEFDELWPFIQDDIFEMIQIPINVFDHRLLNNGALNQMRLAGKKILARSVYLQGLFFLDENQLPATLKDAAPFLSKLRTFAEQEGMTVEQLAFTYVRDLPGIDSIILGAETSEQIRKNIALMQAPALREETRAYMAQAFANTPTSIITPHEWKKQGV